MTPEDTGILTYLGSSFYLSLTIANAAILSGIYTISFFTALWIFCSKPIKGNAPTMLTLIIIVCISLTLDFISRNGTTLSLMKLTIVNASDAGLSLTLENARNKLTTWETLQFWGPTVNLIIGDGLVLWRAWVIWDVRDKRNRSILGAFLMLLMIGNIGVNVADAAFDDIGLDIQLSAGAITLDWVSLLVSLVVNAVATFLIGLRAWYLHRESKHLHTIQTGQLQVKSILLILVESGLVFCIIQILYAVLNGVTMDNVDPESALYFTYSVITGIANGCAALYPLAIIIIVHLEASPLMTHQTSNSGMSLTYA